MSNRLKQDRAEVKALASLTLVCQGLNIALVTALVEEASRAVTAGWLPVPCTHPHSRHYWLRDGTILVKYCSSNTYCTGSTAVVIAENFLEGDAQRVAPGAQPHSGLGTIAAHQVLSPSSINDNSSCGILTQVDKNCKTRPLEHHSLSGLTACLQPSHALLCA